MESPIKLVLIGGVISLVSTLAGILLQYWLEKRKLATQIKEHPTRVVYDKQTEFFDKLAPILLEVNSYISSIDVWLHETGKRARQKVKEVSDGNSSITEFEELLQHYYMYLPKDLLEEANELYAQGLFLSD